MLFSKKKGLLRTEFLHDWGNVFKVINYHSSTSDHLECITKAVGFTSINHKEKDSICESLSKAYADKVKNNRLALESIIYIIILCAQTNTPFRDRTDETSNFSLMVKHTANTDIPLPQHLERSRRATYLGHRTQNDLITLCGNQIRSDILDSCLKSKYYTIWLMSAVVSVMLNRLVCVFGLLKSQKVFVL